jgi:gamma-glutamyltranspeptidase/glutathione hydrolase
MANNMMGEDDLHPAGFHTTAPGRRVASMMAPSLVVGPEGGVELVVGSGGSKRIRTAMLQVIAGAIDQRRPLADAVAGPRLHWDGERVHIEPGWPAPVVAALEARWPVTRWAHPDLYFGGAHAVAPRRAAAGDPRRGGSAHVGMATDP